MEKYGQKSEGPSQKLGDTERDIGYNHKLSEMKSTEREMWGHGERWGAQSEKGHRFPI